MDETNLSILRILLKDGRAPFADIAASLGLARQTVTERIQRMRESGVLLGFSALVAPEKVGADLTAFIGVTVDRTEQCAPFLAAVERLPEVVECHHVAGDDSYLLKVRTAGTRGLEELITNRLKRIPGVVRTRTTIVLSTSKETVVPPALQS